MSKTNKTRKERQPQFSNSVLSNRGFFRITLPNQETADAIMRLQKKDIITLSDCYQKGDLLLLSVEDKDHLPPNDAHQHQISNFLYEITFVSQIPFSASHSLSNPNGWVALSIQPFGERGKLVPTSPPTSLPHEHFSSVSTSPLAS